MLEIDPADGSNALGNPVGTFRLNNLVTGRYEFVGGANGGIVVFEFVTNGVQNRFSLATRLPETNVLMLEGYGEAIRYRRAP